MTANQRACRIWPILIAAALLLGACAPSAHIVPTTQPLEWLRSSQYATLNDYYAGLQRRYEAGTLTDAELYQEFHKLYADDPRNARFFDEWLREYPTSYVARVAQGAYYYRMAWAARGSAFLQDTSALQLFGMQYYLSRARPILLATLKLSPKPYLSTLYLLNVAMLEGTAAERQHWLAQGLAIDPHNSMLRIRYMTSLEPRWGGSLEEMRAFADRSEREGMPARALAQMRLDLAYEVVYAAPQVPCAQRLAQWREVLKEARAAGFSAPADAVAGSARCDFDLHDRATADRLLAQLVPAQINDAWTLSQIAFVYINEQRMALAWGVVQKAARLGDAWSQMSVGLTLYRGCPELRLAADQPAGLKWIRRAAAQGFPDAVQFLRQLSTAGKAI